MAAKKPFLKPNQRDGGGGWAEDTGEDDERDYDPPPPSSAQKPTGLAAFAKKAVKATDLNKYSLFEHMGGAHAATNQVSPTSSAGIRRAMQAGLVEVKGKELHLTEAGKKEQAAYEAKEAPARVERSKNRLAENENILKIAEKDGRTEDATKARAQVEKWKGEVAKAEAIHSKHGGKASSSSDAKPAGKPAAKGRIFDDIKEVNPDAATPEERWGGKPHAEWDDEKSPGEAPEGHTARLTYAGKTTTFPDVKHAHEASRNMGGHVQISSLEPKGKPPEKISTEEKKADPKLSKLMQAHDDAYMRAKYAGTEAEKKQGEADLAEHKARISKHVQESHKADAADEPAGGKDANGKPLFDKPPSAEALALMGKGKNDEKEIGAKMKAGLAKEEKDYAAQKTQTAHAGNMFTKPAAPEKKTGAQSIQTGAKGGRYYVNASGTKVYVK